MRGLRAWRSCRNREKNLHDGGRRLSVLVREMHRGKGYGAQPTAYNDFDELIQRDEYAPEDHVR